MIYRLNTSRVGYYKSVLNVLNTFYKLSGSEIEILSSLLILYDANRDDDSIDSKLLSTSTRKYMYKEKLHVSEATFNNYISSLMKKKFLVKTDNGYRLSKELLRLVPSGNNSMVTFNYIIG